MGMNHPLGLNLDQAMHDEHLAQMSPEAMHAIARLASELLDAKTPPMAPARVEPAPNSEWVDPLLADNPALTRETAEAMLSLFGG